VKGESGEAVRKKGMPLGRTRHTPPLVGPSGTCMGCRQDSASDTAAVAAAAAMQLPSQRLQLAVEVLA
jgi:hypothetical protein